MHRQGGADYGTSWGMWGRIRPVIYIDRQISTTGRLVYTTSTKKEEHRFQIATLWILYQSSLSHHNQAVEQTQALYVVRDEYAVYVA